MAEIDIAALVFFCAFGTVGVPLAFDVRGFTNAFFTFTARVMGGVTGTATPRTLRLVGAGMIVLSLIGVVAEASKPFRC
ncbi:hypothetical protein AB0957_31465 [Streptomyces zhihengii]|uniref:hypothetical protein n=1 Tax=Streptomyces zhihengii TaxID=1818004 RepID=UPI003451C216